MARIRTIKPDFWSDERLTECSVEARLLFIGMWNFADDGGNLQRSPRRLKMQIFPADTFEVEPLIDELIAHGVLREYLADGANYLNIKNFRKHQRINRPSISNIPPPQFNEDSLSAHENDPQSAMQFNEDSLNSGAQNGTNSMSTHGGLNEDSLREGKGREGKGREGNGKNKGTPVAQSEASHTPPTAEARSLTPADVCIAFREQCGIARVNPSHADLAPLIAAGAALADFVAAGHLAKGKTNPFTYAIATVKGRLAEGSTGGQRGDGKTARTREYEQIAKELTGGRLSPKQRTERAVDG